MSGKRGFVAVCTNRTERECFGRMLFGYKPKWSGMGASRIEAGGLGFLLNRDEDALHGVFQAATAPAMGIVPGAWGGGYPLQIRVVRYFRAEPLRGGAATLAKLGLTMLAVLEPWQAERLAALFQGRPAAALPPRPKHEPGRYISLDGHRTQSQAEAEIDDWLHSNREQHRYAVMVPIPEGMECDFYLPDRGLYVEYWGLSTPEYTIRKNIKIGLYAKYGLSLLELKPDCLRSLDEVMTNALKAHPPSRVKP